jgi:hypothetical protein
MLLGLALVIVQLTLLRSGSNGSIMVPNESISDYRLCSSFDPHTVEESQRQREELF